MTTELTQHWRSLYENKYLGAWNLWDEKAHRYTTVTVKIQSAQFESITMQGGRKSKSVVVRFVGKRTPMIVTKTMGKVLEKMCGKTPSEWCGKDITLYVEQNVKLSDGPADVLRIRNTRAGADLKAQLRGEETVHEEPERFESDEGEPPRNLLWDRADTREPGEEG